MMVKLIVELVVNFAWAGVIVWGIIKVLKGSLNYYKGYQDGYNDAMKNWLQSLRLQSLKGDEGNEGRSEEI